MTPRASQRGIELVADLQSSAPDPLIDRDRTKLVLLNLLENALKFAEQPGGRIEISLYFLDGHLKVNVKDDGEGIAEEEQASIFDKFYQVKRNRQTSRTGSGLGLAISKQIIELHGGRLWVESELGKGAKFSFLIPVQSDNPQ